MYEQETYEQEKIEYFESLKRGNEIPFSKTPFEKHRKKKKCCCGQHSFKDLRKRNKYRRMLVESGKLEKGEKWSDLQIKYSKRAKKDKFSMIKARISNKL